MVVGIFKFLSFIRNTRIEDKRNPLLNEPFYMSVSKFCRITFGFTWDWFNAKFVNFSIGSRRKYYAEFQSVEKCKPERIVLIHIQHTWNANSSPDCLGFVKRLIIEITLHFICKQVRHTVVRFFFSETAFTAVTGNEFASAAEFIDRQTTVIRTAFTFCHAGTVL